MLDPTHPNFTNAKKMSCLLGSLHRSAREITLMLPHERAERLLRCHQAIGEMKRISSNYNLPSQHELIEKALVKLNTRLVELAELGQEKRVEPERCPVCDSPLEVSEGFAAIPEIGVPAIPSQVYCGECIWPVIEALRDLGHALGGD